jgi:hypothetical protein
MSGFFIGNPDKRHLSGKQLSLFLSTMHCVMAFEHHAGLAALHAAITGGERTASEETQQRVELEAIAKDIQDDAKVNRPTWKGFGS